MNGYTEELKNRLHSSIEKLKSSPEKFLNNPSKDFTRKRKLPLKDVIMQLIGMGATVLAKNF